MLCGCAQKYVDCLPCTFEQFSFAAICCLTVEGGRSRAARAVHCRCVQEERRDRVHAPEAKLWRCKAEHLGARQPTPTDDLVLSKTVHEDEMKPCAQSCENGNLIKSTRLSPRACLYNVVASPCCILSAACRMGSHPATSAKRTEAALRHDFAAPRSCHQQFYNSRTENMYSQNMWQMSTFHAMAMYRVYVLCKVQRKTT